MKRLQILIMLMISFSAINAQEGLEGIILEKYYVTSAEDALDTLHSGAIPAGSVTYRVFVDLAPGYRFQAAYGTKDAPLIIRSTEKFYNHVESGQAKANIVPNRSLHKNILLLDSWLSAGAAGEIYTAIPKKYDTDGFDSTLALNKTFFHNKKRKMISIYERDGLVRNDSPAFAQFFQIDSAVYHLGSATNGNTIRIDNGAWACLGKGSVGADSLTTNTVLIAQLTTKGKLNYQLNLMIGTPDGRSLKYSYNPIDGESLAHAALTGGSNVKRKKKSRK